MKENASVLHLESELQKLIKNCDKELPQRELSDFPLGSSFSQVFFPNKRGIATMLRAGNTAETNINVGMLVAEITSPPTAAPNDRVREPAELKRPRAPAFSSWGIKSAI